MVPIYATFRTHAHFLAIDAAAERGGLSLRSGADLAAVLNAAAWLTGVGGIFLTGLTQALTAVITAALYGWLTYRGQAALNAYWSGMAGRQIPERTHGFEWFALALSVLVFIGVVGAPFVPVQ
jgi:hypothetical protein